MKYRIPFNKPTNLHATEKHIHNALSSGQWSGGGFYTKKVETMLKKATSSKLVLLTPSCTASLEFASLLLDINVGDEVIVPSFTFVSTANAFVLRGAKIIFADIRTDTLNIDENKIESLVSKKTKAIVVVHYAGVPCEMSKVNKIANKYKLAVIEDSAQALYAEYNGRPTGSLGDLAAFSFHDTKNFTCGEGGVLTINKEEYAERAQIIQDKGTNRQKFLEGLVDKYTWVDIGSSYQLSDILAAILYSQLRNKDEIINTRKKLWYNYHNSLSKWAKENNVTLASLPSNIVSSHHIFFIVMNTPEDRKKFIKHMKKNKIQVTFHYQPLHSSEFGKRFRQSKSCPVATHMAERIVRLPLYHSLGFKDQAEVISIVKNFSTT